MKKYLVAVGVFVFLGCAAGAQRSKSALIGGGSSCTHPAHPKGHVLRCKHTMHFFDKVRCRHICEDEYGESVRCDPFDEVPCTHIAHVGGHQVKCKHPAHPGVEE